MGYQKLALNGTKIDIDTRVIINTQVILCMQTVVQTTVVPRCPVASLTTQFKPSSLSYCPDKCKQSLYTCDILHNVHQLISHTH